MKSLFFKYKARILSCTFSVYRDSGSRSWSNEVRERKKTSKLEKLNCPCAHMI